jgi:integrase
LCDKYPKYNPETILTPLSKNKIDIYQSLDSFVTYILDTNEGISTRTVNMYMTAIRSYLAYYNIDVLPSRFKRRVKMPKVFRDEKAVDSTDIRKLLLNCNNRRLKTLLLILASGGMRVIEALALRHMDLDFSTSPTKIHLRKEYSKTKVARDVYIFDEAIDYLKKFLEYKNARKGKQYDGYDLVFTFFKRTKNPQIIYAKVWHEFDKLLELVGMATKKEEGHNRKETTFHSLRRHAKTVIANQVNVDYSEWFLGQYKSPYWNFEGIRKKVNLQR